MPDLPGKVDRRAIRSAFGRLILEAPVTGRSTAATPAGDQPVLALPSVTLASPQVWGALVRHPFEVVGVRLDDRGRIRGAALRLMVPRVGGGFDTTARRRNPPRGADALRAGLMNQAAKAGVNPVPAARAIGLAASAAPGDDGALLAARYLDLAQLLDTYVPYLRATVDRKARSVERILRTLIDRPQRWRSVPPQFAPDLRRLGFPDLADSSVREAGLKGILALLERARQVGGTTSRGMRRIKTDWIEVRKGFSTERPQRGTLRDGGWVLDDDRRQEPARRQPADEPTSTRAAGAGPVRAAPEERTHLITLTLFTTAGTATFFERSFRMSEALPDDAGVLLVATWLRIGWS